MRLVEKIISSADLKKTLNQLYPEQSIESKTEKNLKAIFKKAGVEKVNLELLITAMVKGRPYYDIIEQMNQ